MIAPSKAVRSRITGPLPRLATQNLGYPMGGLAGERAGDALAVRRAKT